MESPKCSMLSVVAGLLLLSCVGWRAVQAQKLVPAVFILGDSLSDPGNNNYIQSLAKADTLPNGMDFEGGIPTGRFCNGRTVVDVVGQLAGFTEFIPPYLAPNTSGKIILNGVNYASGAGGILDSSGFILMGRLSMNKQIEYFANTKAQIISLIGEDAGMKLINEAMFTSNMGSNDYLNNYYQPFSPVGNLTNTELVAMLMRDYKVQLTKLYDMGMRKMALANVGPIGCIPFQLTFRLRAGGRCSDKANGEAREFNAGLLDLVKDLNANLPGATFVYADAYNIVSDMIANPQKHGFKVVDMGCCGGGPRYKGLIPCVQGMVPCDNRPDYLFWDPYHPTDKANEQLAHIFWEGHQYTYPMNIKELALL